MNYISQYAKHLCFLTFVLIIVLSGVIRVICTYFHCRCYKQSDNLMFTTVPLSKYFINHVRSTEFVTINTTRTRPYGLIKSFLRNQTKTQQSTNHFYIHCYVFVYINPSIFVCTSGPSILKGQAQTRHCLIWRPPSFKSGQEATSSDTGLTDCGGR